MMIDQLEQKQTVHGTLSASSPADLGPMVHCLIQNQLIGKDESNFGHMTTAHRHIVVGLCVFHYWIRFQSRFRAMIGWQSDRWAASSDCGDNILTDFLRRLEIELGGGQNWFDQETSAGFDNSSFPRRDAQLFLLSGGRWLCSFSFGHRNSRRQLTTVSF